MSKQRAKERAARLAEGQARRAKAERREVRRRRLRALRPTIPRRTGTLSPRRSRAERTGIIAVGALALFCTWYYVDDFAARIALTVLLLVAAPALITMTIDRRTR